jgi:hypothetical protein
LPPSHLSARVPWHDADWTGRICTAPAENHSCTVDLAGYRADWEAKLAWYAKHGIEPRQRGGGPNETLVWSEEGPGGHIDAQVIETLAVELFGG